ncbi:MAG: hypothetical protein PHV37_04775 [Candidatus Gastranaerophilales bacterium]|nr:hypothetical protein [Candidatus Gastranaerophilales bacterium]
MKKIFGKFYKLFLTSIFVCFFIQCTVFAYETVIIDFPNDGWHKVFYKQQGKETIVQYVPSGQTQQNFNETVIFHSYKWRNNQKAGADTTLQYHLNQAHLKYKDMQYKKLKDDPADSIATWCSASASQCEIVRAAQGYEGIITMHYINKNPMYFHNVYPNWYNIIRLVRIYYSYYRWNNVMGKELTVEL